MIIVKLLRTGEGVEQPTRADAEMFIKLCVMFTNERIRRGLEQGKRDSKRNYEIIER
jgi:hypothetical protein